MAAADTAKMIVELDFKSSKFTAGIKSADASLGKLETRVGRMGNIASKGMSTLAGNVLRLGAVAAAAGAGLIALSIKEGQEAAKVQAIYARAIANSGKVSKEYVAILDAQQLALMNLSGVDDELIQTEQTRLIQMGLNGKQVATLTPLILDLSKATGRDLLTSTVAVGKAVSGNVAGLQRFGIFVDKAKAKVDPFAAVMEALNQKFGGTTQALSGTLEARLGALRENLANIRENIGIKLLPAITRIVDVVGKSLIPAFAKLVDRILPSVSQGIDEFAAALESGGAEKAVTGISDAIGTMVDLLKLAAAPVKAIVGAFMSLPKELQTVLIAGFAVNKLSGGMLIQLGGELFKRGGTPANPLFVKEVGLPGGLGGGKGVIPAVGGGSLLAMLGAAGITAAAVAAAAWTVFKVTEAAFNPPGGGHDPTIAENRNPANVQAAVWSTIAHNLKLTTEPAKVGSGRGDSSTAKEVRRLGDIQALAARITAAGGKASAARIEAIMAKNARATTSGDDRITAGISRLNATVAGKNYSPVINVNPYVGVTVSVRNIATANRIATAIDVRKGTGGGKIL